MKSLEDLKKLRDAAQSNMSMRTDEQQKYRVVVGMANLRDCSRSASCFKHFSRNCCPRKITCNSITNWMYWNVHSRTNRRSV